MKVLKFGGTSVGTPERMQAVARLITTDTTPKIVVLSAVSGTTNSLLQIGENILISDLKQAQHLIEQLHQSYQAFSEALFTTPEGRQRGRAIADGHFDLIHSFNNRLFGEREGKELVAQGELLSTELFTAYLHEQQIPAVLLSALDFMQIDVDEEPLQTFAETQLQRLLQGHSGTTLFITQGFICRNAQGAIDNLKRGGSDYTASLVGAAVRASEIQIWTDIDGMHNNDPRIVNNTFPVAELSFDEAAELAYFGAKILHPSTIRPAQRLGIPVRLLNTMQPEARGTLIAENTVDTDIKAIAAKDGITAIKIKSGRMLLAYGFLRKVFEVFERYKTPIDLITTSEVAVSLTIDKELHLKQIMAELENFGTVEVDRHQTIVCVVGSFGAGMPGIVARVLDTLRTIPLRMVSYGGSEHNISLLIDTPNKHQALNLLNEGLFESVAGKK